MTRPPIWAYVVGNGFVALALCCSVGWSLWIYFTTGDQGAGVTFCVSLAFGIMAGRCHERVRRYEDWRREWDALGGGR